MSKKLFCLISFVFTLSLVSNASAVYYIWDNDNGAGDRLWDTAVNWDPDGVPVAGDWAELEAYYVDDGNGLIINADTDVTCEWFTTGYYESPAEGEAVVIMTGGNVNADAYIGFGFVAGNYRFDISDGNVTTGGDFYVADEGTGAIGVVNMSGGTITIGEDLQIGEYDDATGTFNMSAGYLEVADQIYVGFYSPNPGTFNLTGGTVHVYEFVVGNNWGDEPAGAGHLKLHGGTIYAEYFAFGGEGASTIDVTDGVLIADEDLTVPNGYMFNPGVDTHADEGIWTGTLPILIEKGLINAYDVNDGEIITDGNYPAVVGRRAVINVDYDITNPGKTTLSATTIDPNLAWNPNPSSGATWQPLVITLSWSAGENAASHDVYFGTSFNDVDDANTSSDPNIYRGSQPLADVNYTPPETPLVLAQTYYWRIDEVNNPMWKGIVWNFTISPGAATNPSPLDDAEDVPPIVVLSWTPGIQAVTHEVYISSDFNDVNDRDPRVLTVRGPNNYAPDSLEFSTLYYWAVDEFNNAADVNLWYGDIWSFTTADYLIVDDFEPYLDLAALTAIWTASNGRQLSLEAVPDYVRDGNNSMLFAYRNAKVGGQYRGSEAEALASALGAGTDWTVGGAEALVLYFQGDPCNAREGLYIGSPPYHITNDQMYVAVEDGGAKVGIVKYDKKYNYDMNDIKEPFWHEWNIDLQDPCLIAVDMNNIAKVYIGFGGAKTGQSAGGAGTKSGKFDTVWFDDIRLWPPRCRTEFVATDFTGDCITDFADVGVMSDDWLLYDYNTVAAAPSGPNLIGWWKFDEGEGNTVADSSAYDNNGVTINPTPSWVAGYPGDPCDSAMYFDGISDYVVCAEREGNSPGIYDANLMPDKFTVSCWTKLYEFLYFSSFVGNGIDTGSDECGFFFYNWGWEGPDGPDFGLAIRIEGETGMTYVETPNIYDTKRWYHLAATYDGQYVSIYVDGAPAAGPTDVGGPILWISPDSGNYPANFTIGSWEDPGYSLHVDGIIDEVRYYDYALSQGEIAILAELVAPGVEYYQPVPSLANITDPEAKFSRKVNFRDFAIMADHWLEGPTLWP